MILCLYMINNPEIGIDKNKAIAAVLLPDNKSNKIEIIILINKNNLSFFLKSIWLISKALTPAEVNPITCGWLKIPWKYVELRINPILG